MGVGNAQFDAMDELDGDDVRLSSRGRYAERDIVQVKIQSGHIQKAVLKGYFCQSLS